MLKQRVITALVLLAVLLPALFAPMVWPFAALTLVGIAAAGWEWARLNQLPGAAAVGSGLLVAAACGAAWALGWTVAAPSGTWWVVAALWLVAGPLALRAGPSGWPKVPRLLRWLIGCVALWAAWLALSHAKANGVNFLLSVFCLVWAADIAAYFGGRAFGKRKLAPSISPGKSWEGVWSGMAGVLVLALAWMALDRQLPAESASLFTQLAGTWGLGGMLGSLLVLAAMSVVGDLFESLVKRAAGAKDSSQLLPGHGGVLDRIDALLPVFPIALALALA
ncbi:phosphatidate cytidylyltransferase [Ideonella sp. BN130291]|uniref:phosphatidate cytidylyltransferase n=1 Tax=Ideonella sp. BN130291 TaxID=3112940 RepID=UPI002E262450|nr:phosphatidate cytidylyltransferase [Ideonella sp. BN130291]